MLSKAIFFKTRAIVVWSVTISLDGLAGASPSQTNQEADTAERQASEGAAPHLGRALDEFQEVARDAINTEPFPPSEPMENADKSGMAAPQEHQPPDAAPDEAAPMAVDMQPPSASEQEDPLRLPPELAAPPGECDPEVQARVARWLALQATGRQLTAELRKSRDYRNPEFFRKMVEYWEIDEHGTLFDADVFDPSSLPASDTLAGLQKEWAEEEEKRKAARAAAPPGAARIEFTKPTQQQPQSAMVSAAIAAAQAKAAALAAAAGIRR